MRSIKQAKLSTPTNHAKIRALYSTKDLYLISPIPHIIGMKRYIIRAIPNVLNIKSALCEPNDPRKLFTSDVVTLLNEGMLLMLQVTAQNGDIRIYVIEQSIALSNNTQLDDILVNGKSLDGFSPDILEYTYILPYGSVSVPEDITYVTSDSTQTVSVSINALGTPTEIFVTAEDGTKAVYRIHFVPDDFNPGTEPTEDNVCVTSLPDGKWKFTTNCSNVSIMLSTLDGKIMLLKNLELVDVNVPNICSPEAEGYVYDIPDGLIIAYYFIHNNKKVVESGKISSLMYK